MKKGLITFIRITAASLLLSSIIYGMDTCAKESKSNNAKINSVYQEKVDFSNKVYQEKAPKNYPTLESRI